MNRKWKKLQSLLASMTGLSLSESYRAVNLRVFHFGEMRTVQDGAVGEYALHVQCPWRFANATCVATGSGDLCQPPRSSKAADTETWDLRNDRVLQDDLVAELMSKSDFKVISHLLNELGDLSFEFVGGHNLSLFPASSVSEAWRLFSPCGGSAHFVFEGGELFID